MPKQDKNKEKTITLKSDVISKFFEKLIDHFKRNNEIFQTNIPLENLLIPSAKQFAVFRKFSFRAPNAFILYRKETQFNIRNATVEEVSHIAAINWKDETPEKKLFFEKLSNISRILNMEIYNHYSKLQGDITYNIIEC